MIVHTFGPAWNCIDLSPFVVKLLTWLRMAQLPCTTQIANVRKMGNDKLPALTLDDGRLLNDSQQIIDTLRQLNRDPLGANLVGYHQRMLSQYWPERQAVST